MISRLHTKRGSLPESVLGFLVATVVCSGVLLWQSHSIQVHAQTTIDTRHQTEPGRHDDGDRLPTRPSTWRWWTLLTDDGLDRYAAYCNSFPEDEKKKWPQSYYCELKISDFWLACFTGLLSLVTAGLIWVGQQQRIDSKILQRAYLSVDPLGVYSLSTKKSMVGFFRFRNAGNLPATNVAWFVNYNINDDHAFENLPLGATEGEHFLAPRSEMKQGVRSPTHQEIDNAWRHANVAEIEYFLYFWGIVSYSDGFGKIRTLRFCHRYNLNTLKINADGVYSLDPADARQHQHGNSAS
jgi:hypothetical protein